jgi:hypothetical protein
MTLKSGLRFWTTLLSDTSDPLMVGYLLELLQEITGRTSSGIHHVDVMSLNGRVLADIAHDLRVIFDGVLIDGRS